MPGPSGPYTPPPPPRPVTPPPGKQPVITFRIGNGPPAVRRRPSLIYRLLTGPVAIGAFFTAAMTVLAIAT